MNKNYELMTIEDAALGTDGAAKVVEAIKASIADANGNLAKHDAWGKRKFAYQIGSKTEGFYEVFHFEMNSDKLDTFKNKLNLMSGLVRYLITAQS